TFSPFKCDNNRWNLQDVSRKKCFKDLNDIVIRMNKLETAVKEIASKDAVLSEHFKKIGLL
ncbi:MAG TPA: hypothetical protein HPP56_03290, partial [Nitrospirae bacterium]|nr:hypothetical protein [Nitrospirota bacterium]